MYDVVCLTRGRKSSMTCFQPEYKTKLFATEVVMLFKSIIYFSMLAKKAPLGPASLCPSALVLYLTQNPSLTCSKPLCNVTKRLLCLMAGGKGCI